MLAKLVRELPAGEGFLYEPKWDGFRCLVFADGPDVDLRSRNGRPFSRYFPELVEELQRVAAAPFVVDGEIVVVNPDGFDFSALLMRLHPSASRVERLRREATASLVAFDLLALGDDDVRSAPFAHRRSLLQELLAGVAAPIYLTPVSDDRRVAEGWLERFDGGGVDGVVAKHRDLSYESGKRVMMKVKRERTADCVVAGFRWLLDQPVVGSLLLGMYDGTGKLAHVGVSSSFTDARRRELLQELLPFVAPVEGHPWEHGFQLGRSPLGRLKGAAGRWTPELERDWVPLRPELVCEVVYDRLDEGVRFRHPARFRRWRPDRDAASCTFAQFEAESSREARSVLMGG